MFKGGGHAGKVTIGEIGTETKSLIYTGDVMNAISRIQGLCKTYHRKLAISKELKECLKLPTEYTFQLLAEVTLKGKRFSSTVYSILHNGSAMPIHDPIKSMPNHTKSATSEKDQFLFYTVFAMPMRSILDRSVFAFTSSISEALFFPDIFQLHNSSTLLMYFLSISSRETISI